MKVTGKKAEEFALQSYRGGGGQGTLVSVLLQSLCASRSAQKLSCCGHMTLWPDPFHVPLILTWESSRGRHPNGFMCLTCAHTILVGLVLSWKEVERQDPHPFRQQLLVSSGAFRTQQRVTLARVPQLLPQHLPVSRGSL